MEGMGTEGQAARQVVPVNCTGFGVQAPCVGRVLGY